MSVILEFSIPGDEFSLGRVLSGPPDMHLELERIVPTREMVMPFVWATGDDFVAFEERVRDNPHVKELFALDKVGDSGLYRIEWTAIHDQDIIDGISKTDGTVLEASGNTTWTFRLRFPDHDHLSQFYNYCTDHGISIHIERMYTSREEGHGGYQFGLSQEQLEAIVLALRRGYFATPKEVTLDELATELGISRQALSNRIRRANETVLQTVLLTSATDHG